MADLTVLNTFRHRREVRFEPADFPGISNVPQSFQV